MSRAAPSGPVFGQPGREPRDAGCPPTADSAVSPWYLRFEVLDVPGVLADIAGNLAEAGVSIESMIQRGRAPGEPVAIVMITHESAQCRCRARLEGHRRFRQGAGPPVHDSDGIEASVSLNDD